jgi:hypothetical protein
MIIVLIKNIFYSSIDPVTGRANHKRHDDPMQDWTEERKIVEAEKLANTLDRAIK